MGYTTEFSGQFDLGREMSRELAEKIREFSEERHGGNMEPYDGYPGFWCNWIVTDDGKGIEWSGAEKFYEYGPWLELVISRFLVPTSHVLNGRVKWQGEEVGDVGVVKVHDNVVSLHPVSLDSI